MFDVAIEFAPVGSIPDAANRITSGSCDVFMSLIPMTPQRTAQFAMTAPVRNSPVGLIVGDHRRDQFRTWHGVALDHLRIGILVDPSSQADLARLVPGAVEVPIATKADFEQILAQGAPDLDAIVMATEEAAAWTIRYPDLRHDADAGKAPSIWLHRLTVATTTCCSCWTLGCSRPGAMGPSTSSTNIGCWAKSREPGHRAGSSSATSWDWIEG